MRSEGLVARRRGQRANPHQQERRNMETKVTVIDSIMGKGKTTWAADFMAEHPERRFIYCAPFLNLLDEMNERLRERGRAELYNPSNRGSGKRDHFNTLLMEGRDIGVTHCTFSNSNTETVECLTEGHYTLILDEVMDILVEYNTATGDHMRKRDHELMIEKKLIRVDDYGKVHWQGDHCEETQYATVERVARDGNLFLLDGTMLVWQFPPDIFGMFDEVFVLTYLFDGSLLRPYFQYHDIPYIKKSIETDQNGKRFMTEYSDAREEREKFSGLISILDDRKMNDYRNYALSKNWFISYKDKRNILKNNIYKYVRTITKAKANRIMWTTFKGYKDTIKGKGYTRVRNLTEAEMKSNPSEREKAERAVSCFVPCNARGTNLYGDRDVLIYGLNFFPSEYILRYFSNKNAVDGTNITVDKDLISLSAMIQWVWRSAIRNGKPIQIYIPSERMRKLFIGWLTGLIG